MRENGCAVGFLVVNLLSKLFAVGGLETKITPYTVLALAMRGCIMYPRKTRRRMYAASLHITGTIC